MCGICGIVAPEGANISIDRSQLTAMRDAMTHRGPDGTGIYLRDGIGLGHLRLSIIDVAGGAQPMSNEDDSIWITFNGEIYNHASLRKVLIESGHVYRNNSDTETIVHLYEESGTRGIEELQGMFAFALWDENAKRLVLSRDRLGIKPLYYTITESGWLYFASEIKGILAAGVVKPELNVNALPDYLANKAVSGDETMFKGIKQLLPGTTLIRQDGQTKIYRYWDAKFSRNEADQHRSDEDIIVEWRELFREAVRSHLMSDVPLGMFLSGGLDSSAIAAMMSGMVKEPIKTFSVGFAERHANEFNYARVVADAFKTDHHEIVVTPEQFFDVLPTLIAQEDEPLGHDSSIPLYFVSHLAAKHVKVVLSGEGSDEIAAGYGRYSRTLFNIWMSDKYEKFANPGIKKLIKSGANTIFKGTRIGNKLERTFLYLQPDLESLFFDNFSVFSSTMQGGLLAPGTMEAVDDVNPYKWITKELNNADVESALDRMLFSDLKVYLHELLMRQDQMSMSASIESRVPFLDATLVDYTLRLPERMKLRGKTHKYVLRRSMEGILPDVILNRRKMGFPVPLGGWLKGRFHHIVQEYVLSPRTLDRGLFNPQYIKQTIAEHQAGSKDHSERLWSLINLEIWQRKFIDGSEENLTQRGTVTNDAEKQKEFTNISAV